MTWSLPAARVRCLERRLQTCRALLPAACHSGMPAVRRRFTKVTNSHFPPRIAVARAPARAPSRRDTALRRGTALWPSGGTRPVGLRFQGPASRPGPPIAHTRRVSIVALRWLDPPAGPAIELLDQTRLPAAEALVTCTAVPPLIDAIRRLVVRGAPLLGIAGA